MHLVNPFGWSSLLSLGCQNIRKTIHTVAFKLSVRPQHQRLNFWNLLYSAFWSIRQIGYEASLAFCFSYATYSTIVPRILQVNSRFACHSLQIELNFLPLYLQDFLLAGKIRAAALLLSEIIFAETEDWKVHFVESRRCSCCSQYVC